MTFERKNLGKFGEDLAVSFLKKKGYKIIETNFFTRYGEIDIISKKGNKIIFVEVRTKRGGKFCSPEESVGFFKKEKLARTAEIYLQTKKLNHCDYGIDGIFIEIKNGAPEIRHLENILES